MEVRQNLVALSKYGLKCPNEMSAQYITIHNTDNDASADNEIRYMISNNNATSYHFAVDDKEIVQGLPLDRNGWHSGDANGDGNRKSIGIEICYSLSGGDRYYQAERNAIVFIAQLLRERGWGVDRVRKHQDWNGKYCPSRILDEGRWEQVLQAIQTELNGGGGGVVTNTTNSGDAVFCTNNTIIGRVRVIVDGLNIRVAPNANSTISRVATKGEEFDVYANVNDWHGVGGANWVYGNNGEYLELISNNATQNSNSLSGRRVESKIDGLSFRNKPSWNSADVVGTVNAGEGFVIDEKISVEDGYQYRVHNSRGVTYYITASDKYVLVK